MRELDKVGLTFFLIAIRFHPRHPWLTTLSDERTPNGGSSIGMRLVILRGCLGEDFMSLVSHQLAKSRADV